MNSYKKIIVLGIVAAFANTVSAAGAAVTCMQNKMTGKFEEKAVGRIVTGECDAPNAMYLLASLGDVEEAVGTEGTKVVGGVIVTNVPKLSDAVAQAQGNVRQEAIRRAVIASTSAAPKAAPLPAQVEKITVAEATAEKKVAIEPIKPVPVWTLTEGRFIGQELQVWAKSVGWTVIWGMPRDWTVPATTTFTGDFPTAAEKVIKTLEANGALVRAQIYDGNKTVVVTGPGIAAQ